MIVHVNFAKGYRGGERQTQLLIEKLAQMGLNQRLIVRKGSLLGARCGTIKKLEVIEISKPYILNSSQIKGAQIVHAHETKAAQFAFFGRLFFDIPYIITRRVDNPVSNNLFNRLMYNKATMCVALSRAIQEEIVKVASHARITIIPSAFTDFQVHHDNVIALKERFKSTYLIGHIGALVNIHKGQSYLIEAAKELQLILPDAHIIFLGQGPDEATFKEQAKLLHNVTFEGFVENVGDYIAAFDLFVFPSQNEGLGSILFDVMQFHVPIIASKVGGIVDIIEDEHNGLLVPVRDTKALVEAIKTLHDHPVLAQRLATQAATDVKRYSIENMTKRYVKLYTEKRINA